jgi:hypothetical protein
MNNLQYPAVVVGSARRFWSTQKFWIIAGGLLGAYWFFRNYGLPPLFRGRVCCDSTDYIRISWNLTTLSSWLNFDSLYPYGPGSTERAMGYPTLLAFHRGFLALINLKSLDSVDASLFTVLAFYFGSSYFFYRSLLSIGLNLHPIVLFLLLAHPGLTSHAALPLTDTLATSLVMVTSSAIIRAGGNWTRNGRKYALLAGIALGATVLVRPSFQIPVAGCIGVWMFVSAWRAFTDSRNRMTTSSNWPDRFKIDWRFMALPMLALAAMTVMITPQVYSCSSKFKLLCYQSPLINSQGAANGLNIGMYGARTYSLLASKKHASGLPSTSDAFYEKHFGAGCFVEAAKIPASLVKCYVHRIPYLPLYFWKKLIGLADNFHLNTYAATITTDGQVTYNRLFSVLTFLGNVCCLAILAWTIFRRRWNESWFVPLGFYATYLALSVVFHVESRFGFPTIPFALVALTYVCQKYFFGRSRKMRVLLAAGLLLLIVNFYSQVHEWDKRDPLTYETIESIDYQGESI